MASGSFGKVNLNTSAKTKSSTGKESHPETISPSIAVGGSFGESDY